MVMVKDKGKFMVFEPQNMISVEEKMYEVYKEFSYLRPKYMNRSSKPE